MHNVSTLSVIIDRIKDLFGLEHFSRAIITMPSQRKYMMETHYGYERKIHTEEIKSRDVIKIRVFRWLVGLPHMHVSKDVLVRCHSNKKFYVSYRELETEYDRDFNIELLPGMDPKQIIQEMLYGFDCLNSLKESLISIINSVDISYIYLADSICKRINKYGFME